MTVVLKVGLGVVLVGVVAIALLIGSGRRAWHRTVGELDDALTATVRGADPIAKELLPEPVGRYLAGALPLGADAPLGVRLEQTGSFQMGEGPQGWRPFTATEVMRVAEPGFYWDAAIRMAPGMDVRVLDSYVEGAAGMVGKILWVVPVLDAEDGEELRRGALSRYLAEAVWLPSRLASAPGLSWVAVDDHSAEATLEDRGTEVTLRFTFDGDGNPTEVFGLRPREENGAYVVTPWRGRFRNHREIDGVRIPTYGEVGWVIDGEERAYWRGEITAAVFTRGLARPTTQH